MNNPVKSVAGTHEGEETTLEISSWYSTCRACDKGADPRETKHLTRLGYGDMGDGKGCGAKFTKLAAGHYGDDFDQVITKMRPDLEFIG